MRWLWLLVLAAILAGLGYYVWEWNRGLEAAAADNNDAVCQIDIQFDEELWSIYTGGDFAGAVLGNLTSTQDGNVLTTTGSVSSIPPKLINETRQIIDELDMIAGSVCEVNIGKFQALMPGRIRVDATYYRPYPLVKP